MNCKHIYPNKSNLTSKKGNICPYSKLYTELSKGNSTVKPLPIDNAGECLFHSHDIEWKNENHFIDHFFALIDLLSEADYKTFDFRDFVIVNDSNKIIDIKNIDKKEISIDFTGAILKSRIRLLNLNINNLILNDTLFERSFTINQNVINSSFYLERAKLKDRFYLNDTKVGHNAYFGNAQFLDEIKLTDSSFTGSVLFYNTLFSFSNLLEYYEPYSKFCNVVFERSVSFENAVFDCGVEFINISFKADTSFIHTKFSREYYTVFKSPNVKENLSFIGSEKDKLFPYGTVIELEAEDIEGQIIFENVNFKNIKEENRNVLKELSYTDKVSIGSGCIKYRHQTEPRTIHIKSSIQTLLIELVNTYSSFFGEHNGFNLGFEIIEKAEDKITFFYFSDENISEEVFLKRLQKTEVDFWTIIENPEVLYKPHPIIKDNYNSEKPQDLTINKATENKLQKFVDEFPYAKDLLINTASFFLKINVRITHESIDGKDLNKLLLAIHFNDSIEVDTEKITEMILSLFGISMLMGKKDGITNNPFEDRVIEKLEEIKDVQKKQLRYLADIKWYINDLEENFIIKLTDELKSEFEEIKEFITKENEKDGMIIADILMRHIDKATQKLTQQETKIYNELKKSDDWKAKIKFGTPILAEYTTGIDISIEKEYNLSEIGIKLFRKIIKLLEKFPTSYPKRYYGRM